MNENHENNGFFSEDSLPSEAPKRENPYLKKNRDKAKAEKTPKVKKQKQGVVDEPSFAPQTDIPAAEYADKPTEPPVYREEEGYTHKRTFSDWMFEHVKLIATIATALVILALVLITDVVDVVGNLVTNIQQVNSETVTLNYVYGLTQKSEPIQWKDFEKFRHEVSKADDSVTWKLEVENTMYELWVTGVDTSHPPTQVWLIDWKTGDRMTVGVDDLEAFLAEHNPK